MKLHFTVAGNWLKDKECSQAVWKVVFLVENDTTVHALTKSGR